MDERQTMVGESNSFPGEQNRLHFSKVSNRYSTRESSNTGGRALHAFMSFNVLVKA